MADAINAALMKNRFYEQLEHCRRSRPPKEVVSISDKRYEVILEDIPKAKSSEYKSDHELWLLRQYDILKINGMDRLIDPCNKMIYLADGQLFDALHEAHIAVGHGGRTRMTKLLRAQYKNISCNAIELYCDLCEQCKQKSVKPKLMPKNILRGQTALLDFQTNPDGEYNFLLIYQDYLTKFIVLRPLKTNCPGEVAYNLLDIFSVFGAPTVLCYYNSIDYIKQILENVRNFKIFKIIYGDYKHSKDKEYMENMITDINAKINSWMQQNNASHWSIGASFIQVMKNQNYNYDILQNSYKALFGKTIKLGLAIENSISVQTEEDLKKSLCGHDKIVIKIENNKKKRRTSGSDETISSLKKCKKINKTINRKKSAIQILFDEFTCSDSMSETLTATKTIIESLTNSECANKVYNRPNICQNETCASDGIISTIPVFEESSDAQIAPASSVMDTDFNLDTIITDIIESEPIFDNGIIPKNNVSTESTTDVYLNTEATTVLSTPILQGFEASANIFTAFTPNISNFTSAEESKVALPSCNSKLMNNISSLESIANTCPTEQTMSIYCNRDPVFNHCTESDSKFNCYQNSQIIFPNLLQQSSLSCSESFQDTNLTQNSVIGFTKSLPYNNIVLPQSFSSAIPSTEVIVTTHSFSQPLGNSNFSLPQPLLTTLTSAQNINYNLPQSLISTTQSVGNVNFSALPSITGVSSQSLTSKDTVFALPHSNISFIPLTQSIITTPSSNSLKSSCFTVPQYTGTTASYFSSAEFMGHSNLTHSQSTVTPLPLNSYQNLDYNPAQTIINGISASNSTIPQSTISFIPSKSLEQTNFISSRSFNIHTPSSPSPSVSDVNYKIPTPMITTLPEQPTQKDFYLPQSFNNMILTSQPFENFNFISPQNVISTLLPVQSLKDYSNLPQSPITLQEPQALDDTNVVLPYAIAPSDPLSVPPSNINSITSSIMNQVNTTAPVELCDNNMETNLDYGSYSKPFIVTIPSDTYDQTLPLTGSNCDTSTDSNTITLSEPLIIPLPNFESNFFQGLPTLESNECQ